MAGRSDMLELGCGTGHWTKFFCKEGFHVTAIDLSEAQKKNIRCARLYTPVEIRQLLSRFGILQMRFGVHYSSDFDLLDGTDKQDTVNPAFIATLVQKKNE